MTPQQAKAILLLYRPNRVEDDDAPMTEALRLAREDAELGAWFEQHRAFQAAMRAKLRQIEPPAGLKSALLAQRRILRPQVWWRQPSWWAAAAVIVALAGLAAFWLQPRTPDAFADFQGRVVRYALREYAMDVRTNDMRAVRDFMASKGAPADYVLPPGLKQTQLAGGGFLRWRSRPVAMVCFNRDQTSMLYLFVLNRAGVKDPPSSSPVTAKISKLLTVSWSDQSRSYLLVGPEEPGFLEKYVGGPQ
jgi:hypothetical protein